MTSGGEFAIRKLRRADLADVVRIDAHHTGQRKLAYWKRVFEQFLAARHGRSRVGLAAVGQSRVEAHILGYLLGEVRAFEFGSEPCGWVFAVGVDPRGLRAGVGSALLQAATDAFRTKNVVRVRTMVRRSDVPVLSFFRASGFEGGAYVQLEKDLAPGD